MQSRSSIGKLDCVFVFFKNDRSIFSSPENVSLHPNFQKPQCVRQLCRFKVTGIEDDSKTGSGAILSARGKRLNLRRILRNSGGS